MNPSPIKIELPEVANEALKPLASRIGTTLSSIWDITFGWIDNIDEKIKIKRLSALNKYKDSIQSGISAIPPGNLREPKLAIVGPAMEASKYYIEEETLREMFAKVIVNSMNVETRDFVQNSFVEIIKQLSPADAITFKFISESSPAPICKIRHQEENNLMELLSNGQVTNGDSLPSSDMILEGRDLITNLMQFPPQITSYKIGMQSIDNLMRLGLISVDYPMYVDGGSYEIFETHPLVQQIISSPAQPGFEYVLIPGTCNITNWGNSFAASCL